MLHCTSSEVKTVLSGFPALKQACTNLTRPPQWRKLHSRSLLALKQAGNCFTAPPRRFKRRYQVFTAHKQAYTSVAGVSLWSKLSSRHSLALKQACTCFTALPLRLKLLYQDFPLINRLAPTSLGLHSGENCFLDLLWHINSPSRASQNSLVG